MSATFQGLLQRAYRRAWKAGAAEIGTDLVLDCLRFHIRTADGRPLLNPLIANAAWTAETARPDPPPPAGPDFGPDVVFEAAIVLGEAAFIGGRGHRGRFRRKGVPAEPPPVFSPAVRYAVHDAIARTGERAEPYHLAAALPALDCPAADLLRRWIPVPDLRLIEAGRELRPDGEGRSAWAVNDLTAWRVLPASAPKPLRAPWQAATWLATRELRRPYRRHGAHYGHPILASIEANALSKALQTGHGAVTAVHVLLSLIDQHQQLAAAGRSLPADAARWNRAGEILAAHGVRLDAATFAAAVRLEPAPDDAEDDMSGVPTEGWPPFSPVPAGDPVPGRTALTALRRASLSAHRLGHPYAGTTHLLAALLDDPDGPATRLLHELGTDPAAIHSDTTAPAPTE
ncbi:Clp protease N-terminal domain-containing protein [Spirillospora sp. NPDC029432]|uniref:Clp protease N-terminal domain-containing protein n=1 Tax=Spirillospora sp. NPDC029432 TaxID=3154599 RepID=UPI00345290F9